MVISITPEEIRAIRESLGLSQVEAGQLLGGGPRAFTKYEAGTVKPAAAVVKLLRLLEADPSALVTLGGSKSRPMAAAAVGPFEVTGEHIKVLTERTLPELLRRLLSSEAQAHGLPEHGIHVASDITVADGGEDGRITWKGGPDGTLFLPSRNCQFQLKAGRIYPGDAGEDVLTKSKAVKDMVGSVLRDGGYYIMLCSHPYVQKDIEKREERIRQAIRGAGLNIRDEQVGFRDADQIATWVNRHPSVAIWVKERTQPGTIGPFRSWSHWDGRHEHQRSRWVEDERLPDLRACLREQVTEPRTVLRIVGPSGIGKSRLTLEAMRPTTEGTASPFLSDLILYSVETEAGSESINQVVQTLADTGQRAVVVVDHCSPQTHQILAGMVLRSGSLLSLITIDDEVPAGTPDDTTFMVPEAPSSVTEAVIDRVSPGIPLEDRRRLALFSKGFPKIAILVGQAWAASRPVAHATDGYLVDAFVLGRNPREPDLLIKAATLLATFGLVNMADGSQVSEVAGLGRDLISEDLSFAVEDLCSRGVARRRGGVVVLQPRPVAMRLAERQWREWEPVKWEQVLSGDTSPDLKVLAARQLALLNTTDVARDVVRHVCRIGGPFDGAGGLSVTSHAEVLSALAEVDTEVVADQMGRSLSDVKDLADVGDETRRHLVWALEKIAFDPVSFDVGALHLLRLAVAEDGIWNNNATGLFVALFPVVLGNTGADGTARLFVLDEAAATDEPIQRAIVVKALIAATKTDHFSRMVGAEIHGSRRALEPWQPATQDELVDYVKGCVERLVVFATRDDELGAYARKGFGGNLRWLVRSGVIDVVEPAIREVGAFAGYWAEALESLGRFMEHDTGKMDEAVVSRVRKLIDELMPVDVVSRARFLVTEMPPGHLCDGKLSLDECEQRQVQAVRELAAELATQHEALTRVLPQLSRGLQRMSYVFGKAIADIADSPQDWLDPIILAVSEVPEDGRDFDLLSGYLTGMVEKYPEVVDSFKRKASRSPELAPALPLVCWRLGITPSDIEFVIGAFEADLLPPWRLMQWTLGGVLAKVPPSAVTPLFDRMLGHGVDAFHVAVELMGMYAYGAPEKLEDLRPQIRKCAENLTRWERSQGSPEFDHHSEQFMHHFEQLMEWMLNKGRSDRDACATALVLARTLVEVENYGDEWMIKRVVPTMLTCFPEIVWPLIGQAIVSDPQQAWRLEVVLGDRFSFGRGERPNLLYLSEETLFAWCHAHPDRAPAFVASMVPFLTTCDVKASERSLHPVMAGLLNDFGDRSDVRQAAARNIHNFSWSGAVTSYYQLYTTPLTTLRDQHPKRKVRQWASYMLRTLADRIDDARSVDDEREARQEV
ncbi:MAG: type II toxin-antitoxin system MqsA family antitoxin [Deltaproteobacteria bacterium]|nr:type II toxin-antitoxin system MqsA family antitoxin [Deltaproteobacteria bacterium]